MYLVVSIFEPLAGKRSFHSLAAIDQFHFHFWFHFKEIQKILNAISTIIGVKIKLFTGLLMAPRLLHPGPIFALSIISFCFMTSIITILSWLPPNNLKNIVNALLFQFWVVNILKNFFKACFIGPGYVDFKWKPVSKDHT